MSNRITFRDRVAAFLKQNEGRWINAIEFESVGGRQAWRSRLSECKTQLGIDYQNRQRRIRKPDGSSYTVSEYRYVAPTGQLELLK